MQIVVTLGNPKTLTPGPRTPTTDRVYGLPTDRCTDYPYGPTTDQPQNSIKKTKINTSLIVSPIDDSCRRNLERYAEKNITDLSSVSGASLSLHIAISFAVAITMHERPGNSGKPRNLCCFECISSAILLGV